MRIDLLHPGPVRHRPPRGRDARISWVPTVTPVELRDLAWNDTEAGPTLTTTGRRRVLTRLVGGEVWRPIGTDDFHGTTRSRRPGIQDFARWLEGAPGTERLDRGEVAKAFAGTPVVARPIDRMVLLRGREGVPADLGLVLADHRDAAQTQVAELFRRDVALVDGIPMMRLRGPVACRDIQSWTVARTPGWTTIQPGRGIGAGIGEGSGLFYRLDRALAQPSPDWGVAEPELGWDPGEAAALRYRGDEDVSLTLDKALAGLAWRDVWMGWEDRSPEGLELRERILDAAAAATAWVGDDADLPARLDLVERGCRAWSDPARAGVLPTLAYLHGYAAPVLAARGAAMDADADALGALAP